MVTIIDILKQIPLFQGLEELDLKKISEVVKQRTLPAGTCLFKEGDHGDAFYLLKEGTVEVYKSDNGAEKLVTKISHSDESNFFGEMALIEGVARNATIKTASECKVLEIDKVNFDMLLRLNSFIALRIMTALSRRLRKEVAPPKAEEMRQGHHLLRSKRRSRKHMPAARSQQLSGHGDFSPQCWGCCSSAIFIARPGRHSGGTVPAAIRHEKNVFFADGFW